MVFFFDLTRYEQWVVRGLHHIEKEAAFPMWISQCVRHLSSAQLVDDGLVSKEALSDVLTSPGLDQWLSIPYPKNCTHSSPAVPEVWRQIMGVIVEVACCGDGVWVMNSGSAMSWVSDLEDNEDPLDQNHQASLIGQFDKLSGRMSCWNDGGGGYLEGVHGWLSCDECVQLCDDLKPLGLMDLPPGDQSLDKIGQSSMIPYLDCLNDFGEGEATRGLTLLQSAAKTAASQGLGLVWFNDPRLVMVDGWGACRKGSIVWRRLLTTVL